MGYRASRQATTKHSPYFMLFQQNMRLPVDCEVMPPADENASEEVDCEEVERVISQLMTVREQAFKKVEANITTAQKQQKQTYDRKHQQQALAVGVTVLMENTRQKQRKGGRWSQLFLVHTPFIDM